MSQETDKSPAPTTGMQLKRTAELLPMTWLTAKHADCHIYIIANALISHDKLFVN